MRTSTRTTSRLVVPALSGTPCEVLSGLYSSRSGPETGRASQQETCWSPRFTSVRPPPPLRRR